MAELTYIAGFRCPHCKAQCDTEPGDAQHCRDCGWTGRGWFFQPVAVDSRAANDASAEDNECAHHPGKQAVAVCAGTGDYICELCKIEVDGESYSAAYLSGPGREVAAKSFERYFPRPDRAALVFLGLCIVPYVNVLFPVWIIMGFINLSRAIRLRGQDPLYARIVGRGRIIVVGVVFVLVGALIVIGIIMMILEIITAAMEMADGF